MKNPDILTGREAAKELAPYVVSAVLMIFLWGMIAGAHPRLVEKPRVVTVAVQQCKLLPPPVAIAAQ